MVKQFKPMPKMVFVTDLENGVQKTAAGIIIPDDNMKDRGIKPRWGKVWSFGSDITDLSVGQWLYIEHGRWTLGIDVENDDGTTTRVWRIDYPSAAMIVSDEDPRTTTKVEKL